MQTNPAAEQRKNIKWLESIESVWYLRKSQVVKRSQNVYVLYGVFVDDLFLFFLITITASINTVTCSLVPKARLSLQVSTLETRNFFVGLQLRVLENLGLQTLKGRPRAKTQTRGELQHQLHNPA